MQSCKYIDYFLQVKLTYINFNLQDVYITKLRPYVETFLEKASTLFDISIFTLGNLAYTRRC